MSWNIDIEFIREWLVTLDEKTFAEVSAAIDLLAQHGPHLGRPFVDTVAHSRINNLKELRPGSPGRSEIRILFAFDPRREAIMLVAGDKRGERHRWYRKNIRRAEHLFEQHLKRLKEE